MKNRLKNQKGFTLIELVMVIVILGILAAVAIPRFIDLQTEARTSVAEGITGALAGQITMLHARYLISGNVYDQASVAASIDQSGFTLGNAANVITATLDDGTVFSWTYTDNGSAAAAIVTGPN